MTAEQIIADALEQPLNSPSGAYWVREIVAALRLAGIDLDHTYHESTAWIIRTDADPLAPPSFVRRPLEETR